MIPEHVLRELRYIELRAARKIRNPRIGAYTSRMRGPGFDFDQHHPYNPGDDVRRIDWNVTARMNAPYVRHTHAERELTMAIAMDVSRSMDLGTSHYSKREAMTFITASLLFSALANQINTSFVAFSDRVVASSPPRRTRAAAWRVLEQCWAASGESDRTALAPMLRHLLGALRRTTIVFIVSDFLTDEDLGGIKELAMLAARHDVIGVVPEDPAERDLPSGQGILRVRDLESRRRATVGLGSRIRGLYAAYARRRREALTRMFYRVPMDHVFVPTDESPVEPLLSYFARAVGA